MICANVSVLAPPIPAKAGGVDVKVQLPRQITVRTNVLSDYRWKISVTMTTIGREPGVFLGLPPHVIKPSMAR